MTNIDRAPDYSDSRIATWDLPTGDAVRVSRKGIHAGTTHTPEEARALAYALLAAANYAERNQE